MNKMITFHLFYLSVVLPCRKRQSCLHVKIAIRSHKLSTSAISWLARIRLSSPVLSAFVFDRCSEILPCTSSPAVGSSKKKNFRLADQEPMQGVIFVFVRWIIPYIVFLLIVEYQAPQSFHHLYAVWFHFAANLKCFHGFDMRR